MSILKFFFVLFIVPTVAFSEGKKESISFPTKAIEIVVPWAAGGTSDLTARALAAEMKNHLPQPVIVTNITGAGGATGHIHVKNQRPDGHTILFSSISFLGGYFTGQFPFTYTELQPLANLSDETVVVVVHGESPYMDLNDLIMDAKKNPGKISWAITGTGNSTHIVAEGIRMAANIEIQYVSFDGGAQVRAALMGKHVTVATMTGGEAWDYYRAKSFKILAQSLPKRSAHFSEIPTIKEYGIDFSFNLWKGLYVPKGVPATVIAILNDAIAKAVQSKKFQHFLASVKADLNYLPSDQFAKFIEKEDKELRALMSKMGLVRAGR